MSIEDNRKNNLIDFGSINEGECFEFIGDIYLKTEGISVYRHSNETIYNAVNLKDGVVENFDDTITVIPLKNAKLTIS